MTCRHSALGWLVGDHFGIVHAVATIGAGISDVTTCSILPLANTRTLVYPTRHPHPSHTRGRARTCTAHMTALPSVG
jgi:hypothetical protein